MLIERFDFADPGTASSDCRCGGRCKPFRRHPDHPRYQSSYGGTFAVSESVLGIGWRRNGVGSKRRGEEADLRAKKAVAEREVVIG